ncbi:MAG: hypothetical protein PHG96_02585 [Kiritimatiellae bacterium]|nr:hypothetical protein [Kiritimatiellia bacterium]MDD3544230.1 hypothetical protein [Kiritimatiellia bacterium]
MMDIGIVIAVSAGCLIGLGGGVIGTWASIRNTNGPRERAFMIRASVVMWVFGIAFLALMLVLPLPWRFLLWIPYGILLPLGIFFWNRTQRRIREEECGEK